MRKLLVILVLLLTALWAYVSWYWYTCQIKWFCWVSEVTIVEKESEIESVALATSESIPEVETKPVVVETKTEPTPEPEVTTVVEKKQCEILIETPILFWSNSNSSGDVKDLEDFLNVFEWESLEVDWIYGQDDFDAVKRFQRKYDDIILTPWGITQPTWYVYKTTTKTINDIYCSKK